MKGFSQSYIPSFDSLPYMNKDLAPIEQSMLFIVSCKDLQSHNSIQNLLPQNQTIRPKDSVVSIQCSRQEISILEKKDQALIKTEDQFKVPGGKKKLGCVCKKTQCLKLYCECFRKGEVCGDQCSCCNCQNTQENKQYAEETRYGRKRRSKNIDGRPYCNCKKTECQKKYCECFNAGVPCTVECRCNDCTNH